MRKVRLALHRLENPNTVRLVWLLLVLAAMLLGIGAPLAFGGGSGGQG
jgi:hypothetical protein